MTIHSRQLSQPEKLPDDLVCVEDVVQAGWGSRARIYSRIERGVIPAYTVDGQLRVPLSKTAEILSQLGEKSKGKEGIKFIDPSEQAVDRVTKCILENLGLLKAEHRQHLAGLLTGDFDMPIHDETAGDM